MDVPNFCERPEMSEMLRDVREKPDRYAWLGGVDANYISFDKDRRVIPLIFEGKEDESASGGLCGLLSEAIKHT